MTEFKVVRIQIDRWSDRAAIIQALAVAGYKTWCSDKRPRYTTSTKYYVYFEVPENDITNLDGTAIKYKIVNIDGDKTQ